MIAKARHAAHFTSKRGVREAIQTADVHQRSSHGEQQFGLGLT
jgi:hypothetical protein